jgi:hypothetical protein
MWPKALAQLLELAPHVGRLVPAANRFLNPGAAADEASRSSMQQVAEGLRGDIGQVTASHDSLSRQLTEQNERLAVIAADAHAARLSAASLEARLIRIEQRNSQLSLTLVAMLVILAAVCILSCVILTHLLRLR